MTRIYPALAACRYVRNRMLAIFGNDPHGMDRNVSIWRGARDTYRMLRALDQGFFL